MSLDATAMPDTFTAAQVADVSGLPLRWLRFATDQGLFQPEPETMGGGKGRHRRYSQAEATIAAIVAPLVQINVQIGTLVSLAEFLREIMKCPVALGIRSAEEAERIIMRDLFIKRPREPIGDPAKLPQLEDFAKSFGLDAVPTGDVRLSTPEYTNLQWWVHIEEARRGEMRMLRLAFGSDDSWEARREYPGPPIETIYAQGTGSIVHIVLLDRALAKLAEFEGIRPTRSLEEAGE